MSSPNPNRETRSPPPQHHFFIDDDSEEPSGTILFFYILYQFFMQMQAYFNDFVIFNIEKYCLRFQFFVLSKNSSARVSKVEEKFGEQNFRVLSEMRILVKIKVAIFDLVG